MPDGQTHARIHKIGLFPVALFTAPLALSLPIDWLLVQAGYSLGALIDPDLDQVGVTMAEGRALRHFGCLGAVWVGYWVPYGYLLKHRGTFSHVPFISTFIRLVYISVPVWITGYLVQRFMGIDVLDWMIYYIRAYVPIWFGLSIADTFHWIADILPKNRKVVRNKINRLGLK